MDYSKMRKLINFGYNQQMQGNIRNQDNADIGRYIGGLGEIYRNDGFGDKKQSGFGGERIEEAARKVKDNLIFSSSVSLSYSIKRRVFNLYYY